MAISIKSPKEIEDLRQCGKRLAEVLRILQASTKPGVSTGELDRIAQREIALLGCKPVLLGYRPHGARKPYPAATCISVNDEVVHGIPTDDRIIAAGDVVALDCTISFNKMICDAAVTLIVGKPLSKEHTQLVQATRTALDKGIAMAQAGNTTGNIGHAIDSYITKEGFKTVRALAGHGVGYEVHEDPYIPNQGEPGKGEKLVPGMVIAIEPIVTIGTEHVDLQRDGYTYVSHVHSMAAHFEHTVVITDKGPEVLTR
jgi:methionyl aminopeptidase